VLWVCVPVRPGYDGWVSSSQHRIIGRFGVDVVRQRVLTRLNSRAAEAQTELADAAIKEPGARPPRLGVESAFDNGRGHLSASGGSLRRPGEAPRRRECAARAPPRSQARAQIWDRAAEE